MLFKIQHLQGIQSGTVSLAFRKWPRPLVKKGTLQKTRIGLVEIQDIEQVNRKEITRSDAIKSGFESLEDLLKILDSKKSGQIYRMKVRYYSEDPRIALRNNETLSEEEFSMLKNKLERLDKYSKQGDWTLKILEAIEQNPQLRALDLAQGLGMEKDWLKPNVRKLKNLGLTVSHGVGYSISPRGKVFLKKLRQ